MTDPFRLYSLIHALIGRAREDAGTLLAVALLVVVAAGVAWQVVFAWLRGGLSGMEAFALCVSLFVAESAVVRWMDDFHGLQLALLLALPVAVWAGARLMIRVSAQESHRASLRGDMRRYRAALRRDPENAAARMLLGDVYVKLGRTRQAVAEYRAAVALDPRGYEARYKLARATRMARRR